MRTERRGERRRGRDSFHRRVRLLGCVVLLALGGSIPAAPGATEPTVTEVLQAHCLAREATATLRARFAQTKVFEALGEEDTSSGLLYYRRPDAVRWQYLAPDTSWTVLRGDSGWAVFPRIRQVQRFDLKRSRAEAVLSIVGFGSCGPGLEDAFQITLTSSPGGAPALALVPQKPELRAYFDRVDLTLDARDSLPRQVVMHETSGDTVRFEFIDLKRGVRVDEKLFEYEAPPGYEVVE